MLQNNSILHILVLSKSINNIITHVYLSFNWHHVHQKPGHHIQFHYWMRSDRRHLARCHIIQLHGQESMALHRSCSLSSIMFQQSLEALSVVVYRQTKVYILIQDYGTIWVTTFLLRDCCTSWLHTLPHPTQQGFPMYLLIWRMYLGRVLSFGAIWWVKHSQQP